MHLSSLCTASTRKQSIPYLQTTAFNKIFLHSTCPTALKFTAGIQPSPQISSVSLSSCFSDISIQSPLLSAAPYPTTWLHEVSKKSSAALAQRLMELPQPLAPAHHSSLQGRRAVPHHLSKWCRTWTITFGPVPKCWEGFSCACVSGEIFWSEEGKGVGRDQRRVSKDTGEGKRKSEFFWGSFLGNVFLRNNDLITKGFYLV